VSYPHRPPRPSTGRELVDIDPDVWPDGPEPDDFEVDAAAADDVARYLGW
jgi:hypothetical protein